MFKIAKERYFEEEQTNSTNTVVNITFISIVSVILAVVIFLSSFASLPGLMIAGIGDYVDKEFTEWNVNKANQTIIDTFSEIEKEVSKEIIKEINKKYITGYQGKVTSFWKNENKDTFQICNDDKNGQKDLLAWYLYQNNDGACYTMARLQNYYRTNTSGDKLDSIYFMCAYSVWHQSNNLNDENDTKDADGEEYVESDDKDVRWKNFDVKGLKKYIKKNKAQLLRANYTYTNEYIIRDVKIVDSEGNEKIVEAKVPVRTVNIDLKIASNQDIAELFNLDDEQKKKVEAYRELAKGLFEGREKGSTDKLYASFEPIPSILTEVFGISDKHNNSTNIFKKAKSLPKFGFEIETEKQTGSKTTNIKGKKTKKGSSFNGKLKKLIENSFEILEEVDNSSLSVEQNAIVEQAKKEPCAGKSQCLAWVQNVYDHALNKSCKRYTSANDAYTQLNTTKINKNKNNIPVGAVVIAKKSAKAGEYGHIGIYIGDGKVMHNTEKGSDKKANVYTDTIEDFCNTYGADAWAWIDNNDLSASKLIDTSTSGTGKLGYPTSSRTISAGFPNYSSGRYHGGIDFPVPPRTPVKAAEDGTVTIRKDLNYSYGHYLLITHSGGLATLYAHNSKIIVKQGDHVKKGQIIAYSGSTGNSTGPHCHFEVRLNGNRVNPQNYLAD